MQPASTSDSPGLCGRVQKTPFSELLATWDALDCNGTDVPAIRWLCLNDRYYLLIKVLRRYDAWHPWIYARCREVEADPDGRVDIWSREHYKSTIITFAGVIQEILKDPEITIGIFSHTKPIAKKFLGQIQQELAKNLNLIHSFPEILWANPEKESPRWSLDSGLVVRRTSNPKESTVEAHGLVDGQPTSVHFKLRVYDDVVTLESVNTPEQIMKTTEAWEMSDNLGSEGGREQMVGTRYHHADTYQSIIDRGAAVLRMHACTDNGRLDGKPVLWTQKYLDGKLLKQGDATFSCQNLCSPLAGKQRMFNIEDLREYEVRPETLMVYIMVDPARSMKKDSAHTAMVVCGMDAQGNKYLLDGFDHKMDLMERWNRMRHLQQKWRREPGIQGVVVGYERYGAIADLDYFQERMRIERAHFEIVELEWPREGPGSKNDRVQRLTPDLRGHRMYVPYATDPEQLTSVQRRMCEAGYDYRISRRIRQLDENKEIYDLTERLKLQFSFFPFGDRKDIVDALSRIYDLEPMPPAPPASIEDIEPDVV
jgi:hypothetical protein